MTTVGVAQLAPVLGSPGPVPGTPGPVPGPVPGAPGLGTPRPVPVTPGPQVSHPPHRIQGKTWAEFCKILSVTIASPTAIFSGFVLDFVAVVEWV